MKTATAIVRSFLRIEAVAAIAFLIAPVAQAAYEATIPAPNGVGDVVALTNALTELNALSDRTSARIWLQPGTYNLSGVYMTGEEHLMILACPGGLVAGLGNKPGDTVLLGGGEAGAHRVIAMGGGGNWAVNTISNLTITGGWSASGDGGGILGDPTLVYRNLIVSNNFAKGSGNGAGGGGCFRGCAYNCLFSGNRTGMWGGGFNVAGYCGMWENEGQGAWNCTFVGNSAAYNGGGFSVSGGQCRDCAFTNNTASGSGSGVYFYNVDYATFNGTPLTSCATNCTFSGNVGDGALYVNHDAAQRNVPVWDCVFRLNRGSTTVHCGDLVDCVIECNTNGTGVAANSPLSRCVLRGNAVGNRYAIGIDYCGTGFPVMTNVNCLVESNCFLDEFGNILYRKHYVNCTIIGNYMPNGDNYGYLSQNCVFHNCVLSGNKISTSTFRDVRTVGFQGAVVAVAMTNCVFSSTDVAAGEIGADGTVTHEGLYNCRKIAAKGLKFANAASGDYTPTTRSPLYNAGLESDWILTLAGAEDLAGNARVFDRGIDIGAYECQSNPPGMMLLVY
ncbi:MAG: hypothetical protein IKE55_09765 [Kiritimatiellae bacterium]|nr:hypothetical protein [Kiritimatiellia bacterium]